MPIGVIESVKPKIGRGPGVVRFADGLELTTFDSELLKVAAANPGVTAEYTIEEREGKQGKTYRNVSSLKLGDTGGNLPTETEAITPSIRAADGTPYLLFDRADDEAIVQKLKGQIASAYVYHFKQQGQDIYGLGVDGAEACKRELARSGEVIEEVDVQIEKDEPGVAYFKAYARRVAVNRDGHRIELDSAIGAKRQEKVYPTGKPNVFWFEQGCAKAIRNAILRLIPEEIKARVVEMYKASAKPVKSEQAPPTQQADDNEVLTASRAEPDPVITEPQVRRFMAIARGAKWNEDQIHDLISGYGYSSRTEIRVADYDPIVDQLKRGPGK